jgi:MFS family permease
MENNRGQQSVEVKPRFFYGYIILILSFAISLIIFGIYFSIGIFLKPMLNEFGWTRTMVSGSVSVSWLVSGVLGIVMGGLNDRVGPRFVVLICGLSFGIGCLLMSQISTIWHIYLFYGILIGAGTSLPIPLMSTLSRWFVKRRTIITGIYLLGSGIGGILVPPLASWLTLNYDWRLSYIIMGGLLILVILTTSHFLKRDPSQMHQLPDGNTIVIEKETRAAIMGISLKEAITTRQFWLIFTGFFCFSLAMNTINVHLVPHVTDLGIPAAVAATVLVILNAAGILGRIGLGSLGDKFGNKRLFMLTLFLLAISFAGFIFTRELLWLCLFVVLFGLAAGSGITQQSPLVAGIFGLRSHGLIFGFVCLGHTMGAAIGTTLAGYLFDQTGSYLSTFITCGAASVIGLILILCLPHGKKSV